jgi:hypothetical protein
VSRHPSLLLVWIVVAATNGLASPGAVIVFVVSAASTAAAADAASVCEG